MRAEKKQEARKWWWKEWNQEGWISVFCLEWRPFLHNLDIQIYLDTYGFVAVFITSATPSIVFSVGQRRPLVHPEVEFLMFRSTNSSQAHRRVSTSLQGWPIIPQHEHMILLMVYLVFIKLLFIKNYLWQRCPFINNHVNQVFALLIPTK